MRRKELFMGALLVLACLSALPVWAGSVALLGSNGVYLSGRGDSDNPKAAVQALLAGPTAKEVAKGITTAIPAGTKLVSLDLLEDGAIINLSSTAKKGLNDAKLDTMFQQLLWTMKPFGLDGQVRILINGQEASTLLKPAPKAIYSAPVDGAARSGMQIEAVGLAGKRITMSSGHGWFYNGSGWYTQRGGNCGDEPEDYSNIRFGCYLKTILENDAAYVQPVREQDMNRGGAGDSGHAWWQESSYIWTRNQGYACSVWASYSGRCGDVVGVDRSSDDIRARPLASDLDARGNTDIYVSLHTNAFTGDCFGTGCPSGTDGFYNNDAEHAAWASQSITLAQEIQDDHIGAVQAAGFSGYGHHGSTGALYGNFGEIRIPDRPAALIEMGFHDSCDTDAPKIDDPFFKSVSAWGIYNGVCHYFGNTPTYGIYSSEYVSDTIPTSMVAGEVRTVQITLRNKAVLWDAAHAFSLGAVGDADPFAAGRQGIQGGTVVNNNDTYTFTFDFTAPMTPTTYTTDWQMVRDGYAWFGASLSKQVVVTGTGDTATPTNTPPATPTNTPTPLGGDVIVDNSDGGFAIVTGAWSSGTSALDKYGADYRFNTVGTGADVAQWSANLVDGSYSIYCWYPQGTNRATDAPYTVNYPGGSQTFPTNQQTGGGGWRLLGTFTFTTGAWTVTLSDNGIDGTKVVLADAIKWGWNGPVATSTPTNTSAPPTSTPTITPTNTPAPPTVTPTSTPTPGGAVEVIIDDGAAGYTKSGSWTYTSNQGAQPLNGDFDLGKSVTSAANAWAKWTPTLVAGNYSVYVRFMAATTRAVDAPYTVTYNGGSVIVDVNQTTNGGNWVLLGTYNFAAGTSGSVQLNNGPCTSKNKGICADAVKFTPN